MSRKLIALLTVGVLLALALPVAATGDLPEVCGEVQTYNLWAGQKNLVGHVQVWNSIDGAGNQYLEVKLETTGEWYIKQAHLHVGTSLSDIPTNSQGIPVPGQFAYHNGPFDPPIQKVYFKLPLTWTPGTELIVAVHAEVVKVVDGTAVQEETAWGGDNPGPGPRWWFYIKYTVQECTPPPPMGQWCSPGYWRQPHHLDSWTATGYSPDDVFSAIFGYAPPVSKLGQKSGAPSDPTLLQVLQNPQWYGGDAFNVVGDLLSTAHPDVNFDGTRYEDSCPLN